LATVPSYGGLQTTPTQDPGERFQAPSGPSPGEIGAGQIIQEGQALQRAGEAGAGIATDQQAIYNHVRVGDAINQARAAALNLTFDPSSGYKSLKGDAALTRPDGAPLWDEYGSKLDQQIGTIGQGLSNDAQRRMFQQQAAALSTSFRGDVQSHVMVEAKNFALNTQEGTVRIETDNAKANWNNPDQIQQSVDRVRAAVYQTGRLRGDSADMVTANTKDLISNVHRSVIDAALENGNAPYAMQYMDQNKAQMTGDDLLKVYGKVNQQAYQTMAQGAASGAVSDAAKVMVPSNMDRMVAITANTESGNRDFTVTGGVVTSSAGAQGRMQVMPATAANPGYGIKPADLSGNPQQQAQERARVGTEYLQAMLQKYGDPAKAWAAYNAGPDRVDQALKDSAAGRSGSPDWLSYMPKETQGYVTKNMTALQSNTAGVQPRPIESDVVNAALARLPPGAPPMLVHMTREAAQAQFGVLNKSFNEQRDNAVGAAQRWFIDNPNADISQMPLAISSQVRSIAPDKWDDLVKYGRTLSKGENVTDLVLYNRLASHPDEMSTMSDVQFESLRPSLSQADFKHFANERANILNGSTDNTSGALNSKALNQALTNRLESLGINASPKPTDTSGRQQVGTIQKFARDSIFAQQQQLGRKMTPAEIEEHVDSLFSKDITFRSTLFGMGIPGMASTKPLMQMTASDIPSPDSDAIKAAFAARGIAKPTDDQVIRAYWTRKQGGR
jgi:soluble lytic murein transglycosylase